MVYEMTRGMYEDLLRDRVRDNGRRIRGCGSKQGVIDYINKTFGLLPKITDIRIE